jgi:hypothetical protein
MVLLQQTFFRLQVEAPVPVRVGQALMVVRALDTELAHVAVGAAVILMQVV